MNKKLVLSACVFGLFGIAGCVSDSAYESGEQINQQGQVIDVSSCAGNYLDPACQNNFVNYTEVAADYRQYGERAPRDIRVSQAAAGNNMTASIPPSIENEVIEYEGKVAEPVPAEAIAPVPMPVSEPVPAPVNAPEPVPADAITPAPEPAPELVPASAMMPIPAENANGPVATEEVSVAIEDTPVQIDQPLSDDDVEDWVADEGQNLKALLLEWCERAGWRLVWDTNRNYTLTAGAMFRGNFEDVSSALIRAFARAKPAPVATFYKGNRVLVVETMEDENAY